MAYTSTDLDTVEAAIRALMNGTRTVRLSMGDKSIEYAAADLKALRDLKAEILSEVTGTALRPRFFLAATGKGL
jgi:hypothetical protein